MSLELFYTNFMQEIYSEAEVGSKFNEPVFVEKICDDLVEQATIENYTLCSYKKENLYLKVDAWHQNDENGVLTLIVSHYKDELETLTPAKATQIAKNAVRFFERSLDSNFYQTMEETDLAYPLARDICLKSSMISSVKVVVITNNQTSKLFKGIESTEVKDFKVSYDVWDIERIYRINASESGKEAIEINFMEEFGEYLPCLKAFSQTDEYQSYLLV